MPGQPARYQHNGFFDIHEMGYTEGDQAKSIEYPRDAQAVVAGDETESTSVPVSREPDEQDPGGRRHHQGLTRAPGAFDEGGKEESAYSPEQEPKDERY